MKGWMEEEEEGGRKKGGRILSFWVVWVMGVGGSGGCGGDRDVGDSDRGVGGGRVVEVEVL